MWTIADLTHIENTREQHVCRVERRYADHDRPEAANLPLARHGAPVPYDRRITLAAIVDESEALSFRVLEQEGQAAIPLENFTTSHVLFVEMARPPRQRFAPIDTQAGTDDAARSPAFSRDWPVEECEIRARIAVRP